MLCTLCPRKAAPLQAALYGSKLPHSMLPLMRCIHLQRLELIDMDATPTSLNVAWMAPTKNAHKLVGGVGPPASTSAGTT